MKYLIQGQLAILSLGVFFLAGISAHASSCMTTREYVTSLEFLRDQKKMALPEKEAQKMAREVSRGCTGAAQRFIRVLNTLSRAGLGGQDSVKKALAFSKRTDMETETFITVFRRAFAQDSLDLDLRSSIKMADSLTAEFEGETLAVRDDFEKILDFCTEEKNLNLPRPECGAFAARVAKLGEKWSGGVSGPFIRAFEYMRSEKGAHLATGKALELSEKLIAAGRDSADNFITAHKYGLNKKGLDLTDSGALSFAMEMGLGGEPAASKGE